ncbi:MAG: hypothetical protein R3F41_12300 [Gammaproteobacteria bacterium]|nr:hypothetical protein [Pseudomonadales bacterium]
MSKKSGMPEKSGKPEKPALSQQTDLSQLAKQTEKSKKPTKKARVFREQVKDRHTSHWDLDYLSRAELERLMLGDRSSESAEKPTQDKHQSD